jgi:hypothetical protein
MLFVQGTGEFSKDGFYNFLILEALNIIDYRGQYNFFNDAVVRKEFPGYQIFIGLLQSK